MKQLSLLLLMCAAVCSGFSADLSDPKYEPSPADIVRAETAHRAQYAIVSQIAFATKGAAQNGLADIRRNQKDFEKLAEEENRRASVHGRMGKSGETGLIRYDDLEPEIAKIVFDIRVPLTQSSDDIRGPICLIATDGQRDCIIFAVFNRYTKNYFSRTWYELEEFAASQNRRFNDLLDDMSKDEAAKFIAYQCWPDEHVSHLKIKVQQIRDDIAKVGKRDFSAEPIQEDSQTRYDRRNPDMSAHNLMMAERKEVLSHVDNDTIAAHPEIYAMDVEEIIAAGWVAEDAVKEKYSKSRSQKEPSEELRAQPSLADDDDDGF